MTTLPLGLVSLWTVWFFGGTARVPDDAIGLDSRAVTESSGLAASYREPQIFWTHNDSGDGPRLFAFNLDGECLAEVTLSGVRANDWEDMCSFQVDGKPYLAVADVGDNSRGRKSVTLFVMEEPDLPKRTQDREVGPRKLEIAQDAFLRIDVRYEQGAVDCESLAYDPIRRELLLCSKETLRSRLYRIPFNFEQTSQSVQVSAQQALTIPLATAADISPDGQYLIVSTYGPAFVLTRDTNNAWQIDGESIKVIELPIRRQGESVCFSTDGQRLYVTSEGQPAPFWNVPFSLDAGQPPARP